VISDPASENAYAVLGLPRDADVAALRKAFRRLALERHPDAVADDRKQEATLAFARINEAYGILRDPERRRQYDALLDRGSAPPLGRDLGDASRFQSLAEILGEIRSLGFEGDEDELLRRVDPLFRDALRGALIADSSMREHVLELFHTRVETSAGIGAPDGPNDLGAALACTELRLVLLTRYIYPVSDTNMILKEVRRIALPFESLESLVLHETGRWRPQYKLEVRARSGERFVAGIKRSPISENGTFNGWLALSRWVSGARLRFSRLLFLAHLHGVETRVVASGSLGREASWVVLASLAPFAFMQLISAVFALAILNDRHGRTAEALGIWVTASLLGLAFGAPFLVAGLLAVARAWESERGRLTIRRAVLP
jgi:curved DNA-binding protein CbpA